MSHHPACRPLLVTLLTVGAAVGGGSIAPGSFGTRALAVDPHDPRRLLAGTAARGIFTFTEP